MISYIDDDLVGAVAELGGVGAIAISHPHFYGSMIEWAHAFGAPVYIPKLINGKNKLFFMGNYESYRKRGSTTALYSLASQQVQGGDFSATGH